MNVLGSPLSPASANAARRWQRILLAVEIVLSLEFGLLLLIVPWTPFWDHNAVLAHFPAARYWMLSRPMRGAVSSLGLLNLWFGTGEVAGR
ncbi:MAG: hypothetical protein ACYC6M_06800 [Terriglobales bacterium]